MLYDDKQISILKNLLVKKKLTIAVAESVTAGHLQAALSSAEKAGTFFHGGITAYNLGQKARHLHINTINAEQCNCVSKEVAIDMAMGVVELFSSSVGIGITGYATPVPEEGVLNLFACFAIVKKKKLLGAYKITSHHRAPVQVQVDYVNQVIKRLVLLLN